MSSCVQCFTAPLHASAGGHPQADLQNQSAQTEADRHSRSTESLKMLPGALMCSVVIAEEKVSCINSQPQDLRGFLTSPRLFLKGILGEKGVFVKEV